MTEQEPAPLSVPEVAVSEAPPPKPRSFWLRELPFTVVLILTIAGVASSMSHRRSTTGRESLPLVRRSTTGSCQRDSRIP